MSHLGIEQEKSSRRKLLSAITFTCAVFSLLALLWNLHIRTSYFPHADNFALLVSSCPPFHPAYSDWFLKGFHNYFYVYPDISSHSSNFIRPVVNLVFFSNWIIFKSHWAYYLLANYLIISLLGGITYFIAVEKLALGVPLSLAAALCVIVAPSIDTAALLDPTFAFDLLCGLFILSAVLALISDAFTLCWIFLTFAIFTKEASYFAPTLVAAIIFFRLDHAKLPTRLRTSLAFLIPLGILLLLRWFDFHTERGVYIFMNKTSHGLFRTTVVRIYEGILSWPLAVMVWDNPSHYQDLIERAAVVINVTFWISGIVLVWKSLPQLKDYFGTKRRHPFNDNSYPVIVISTFSAGSLLMPLILNLPRRFGGVFYPLFFLTLALCIGRAKSASLKRGTATLMLITAISGIYLIGTSYQKQLRTAKLSWIIARQYIEVLSSLHEPVVFSLDDAVSGYSSDPYVKAFSLYRGDLVRVNNLHSDFSCRAPLGLVSKVSSSPKILLDSQLSGGCGGYAFDSLFPPLDPALVVLTRTLPQGKLNYHFTEDSHSLSPRTKHLQVEIEPAQCSVAVIYPDLQNLQYRVLLFGGTSSTASEATQVGQSPVRSVSIPSDPKFGALSLPDKR